MSSDTPPRLLVIYNPIAGRRRRRFLSRVLETLEQRGASIRLEPTTARGHAETMARAAATDGRTERLVVAGGDGTINEALNGLAQSALPLAIVPLGTANVLAHELGLGSAARAVAEAALDGAPRAVSLGIVNGRRFSMMAGVGFDAHVVRGVSGALKRILCKGAYAIETLGQLFAFAPRLYDVVVDGTPHRAASVLVCNGHYYGGRFVAAPEARLDRPGFQVVLFLDPGPRATLGYMAALAAGTLSRHPRVMILDARDVQIPGPEGEPVQGDGDIIAHLPARFESLPDAARLVGP
ncbi:MAG: diacylglycerol kinase family lipid kinase [Proteobacteria bacterium]|nr:diacylglycerol kinase family lipid kinase [Pseudomonadota bacterium]